MGQNNSVMQQEIEEKYQRMKQIYEGVNSKYEKVKIIFEKFRENRYLPYTQSGCINEFLDPYQVNSKYNEFEASIDELGKNIKILKDEIIEIKNKIAGSQIGGYLNENKSEIQDLRDSI